MKKVPYCNRPGTLIKNLLWRPFRPTVSAPVNESIFYQLPRLPQNKFLGWLVGCFSMDYRLTTTERAVEVPFAFQHLALPEGARILDFGCCESKLAIELASLGYKVTGVDVHDYELRHPNLSFWKGDFVKNNFPGEWFDGAVAISSIEHCGLGFYGEPALADGDRAVVEEIHRVLKPGGLLILTVPFGKKGQTSWYRVYDEGSLNSLLSKFRILESRFFVGMDRDNWIPTEKRMLASVDSAAKGFTQGVACLAATKP